MWAWGAGNAMKAGRAQLLKLGVTFESFESMEEQCNGSREGLQCFWDVEGQNSFWGLDTNAEGEAIFVDLLQLTAN